MSKARIATATESDKQSKVEEDKETEKPVAEV